MNTTLLHSECKKHTRIAFEEYKRQIEVRLFPLSEELHNNLKSEMLKDLRGPVTKLFVTKNNLSTTQLNILDKTISEYAKIAERTADNYYVNLKS